MKLIRILVLLSLSAPQIVCAQLMNIIGSPIDTVPCNQPCKMVVADFVKPLQTNTYQSSTINYSPNTLSNPTTINLNDDKFSGAIPIGFPFCFYENQYSNVYVSANGHITFNPAYSLGNCSFDTKQGLPFYNATYPDNAIFCPFSDGNTSVGGSIHYQTIGTAPFRKFIVEYRNIPFFGSGSTCTGTPATFQCVLNETTNEIDIHITNKSTCNADVNNWLNYSTLGIQNIGSTNFHVVNNRNATIWTASNEGWKISPSGPPAYSLNWYENNILIGASVDSVNVCDPFARTIVAELTLLCPNKVILDTIGLVKPDPVINSILTTKTNCQNTSTGSAVVNVFGGIPPYSYSINNSPFGPSNTFTNLAYGTHTITVMGANGCTTVGTIFIDAHSTLQALIDSARNPGCPINNGFLLGNATGGTTPYSYVWNPGGAITQNIFNLGPGYYTLEVTDALGCKDQIGYLLYWDSIPDIAVSVTRPVCGDSSGSIDLSVIQGNGPFTYNWSTSDTTQDIHNIPAGTYGVSVIDVNGCSDSITVGVVDTLDLLLFVNGFAHTSCGLNNGMGASYAINGLPPYNYLWSNGDPNAITNTLSDGWQYITVTDANGCTKKDSLNLNPSTPVVINFLSTNAFCDLDNGVINAVVSGSTGPISYVWSHGPNTPTIDSLSGGTYVLTVTDSLGCSAIDSITLVNEGKPILQVVEYIKPLCFGDSTGRLLLGGINGRAPYKYSFDGINFTTQALVTNFAAGTYTIYIRDANSCVSDTTIYFDPPLEIEVLLGKIDTLNCHWDKTPPILFTAQNGTDPYLWSRDGTNYQSNNSFANFTVGTNTIFVKDSNGCIKQHTFNVPGPENPLVIAYDMIGVPCYLSSGGEIDAQIKGGWYPYSYNWSHSASQNLLQTNLSADVYTLSVLDDKNCRIDSIIRLPQNYCCDCYFPNAFTPNGDSKNDVFRAISPAKDIERYELSIYNRWGARIFSTQQVEGKWDGTIKGEPAPVGTYFFKCTLKCLNKADDVFLKGDVILIR